MNTATDVLNMNVEIQFICTGTHIIEPKHSPLFA